jgi:peptidoglycan/LPS O-acetylase OafA/YrhL
MDCSGSRPRGVEAATRSCVTRRKWGRLESPTRLNELLGARMPQNPADSKLGYRPELDGLRGIAIILVLLVHAFNWPRGAFIGVDIFFALSGFLITTLLLEEWQQRGSISLRDFYLRRYYRLFPALAVLIFFYLLYVAFFVSTDVGMRIWGAGFGITYTANWVQAFEQPFPNKEIGYLWTLAIEEQFYLVWPAVLIFLLRRRLGPRGMVWALFGLIGVLVAWRNVLIHNAVGGTRIYFGTDTRFDELLVGCLAGALYVARPVRRIGSRWLKAATFAAGLFLLYRILMPDPWDYWSQRISLTLVAVATVVVIYTCVTGSFPLLTRALSFKWLVFLGTISYSLYLWHVPASLFMREVAHLSGWRLVVSATVLALTAACGSYYLVERTFLKRRRAHERLGATKADLEGEITLPGWSGESAGRAQTGNPLFRPAREREPSRRGTSQPSRRGEHSTAPAAAHWPALPGRRVRRR